MDPPVSERTDRVSRRSLLAALAGAGTVGVAGCLDGEPGTDTSTSTPTSATPPDAATPGGGDANTDTSADETESDGDDVDETRHPDETSTLTGDGSSTVYPVTSRAASVWNSNPPANDREAWGPSQYGIRTDERVADYWAGRYEFAKEKSTQPPFLVNVGLSNSETGLEKVMDGAVDVGDASAPVATMLPDASADDLGEFVDHVVGVDAQPVVVSREVYDAGVQTLTPEQVEHVFTGEIEDWSEIPSYTGPDREVRVVGRSDGSGTDAAFRANLLGDPDAPIPGVDAREDQNQQVRSAVERSDDAIAYLALAFVAPDGAVPPVALEANGTVYEYGENFDAPDYPLSRDLHVYTHDGTSRAEAAFLRMLLSEYGQRRFVESSGYVALSPERRREERAKLPDPPGERPPDTGTASDGTSST